jgi:hypothetical protein
MRRDWVFVFDGFDTLGRSPSVEDVIVLANNGTVGEGIDEGPQLFDAVEQVVDGLQRACSDHVAVCHFLAHRSKMPRKRSTLAEALNYFGHHWEGIA